jgi:hypothetical protein
MFLDVYQIFRKFFNFFIEHHMRCMETVSVRDKVQYRQCTYRRNIEALSRNHCCRRKAISITYCECVSVKGKGKAIPLQTWIDP